jgi:diguanylate cyclase (GGDEF)-like protein
MASASPAEPRAKEARALRRARARLPATTVSVARAATGLLVSLGSPLGWLAVRWLQGAPPREEIPAHAGLYGYLLLSAAVFVTAFGYALGRIEERLRRANEQLLAMSMTDELTGLVNARMFHHELPRLVSLARRSALRLSLVVLDLDLFKRVNDEHGHAAGDLVLAAVGQALHACGRREDVVARIGGEELAVILPGVDGDGARAATERLLAAVRAIRLAALPDVRLTISAGVAELGPREGPEELFSRADGALYDAKHAGRDRLCVAAASSGHGRDLGTPA